MTNYILPFVQLSACDDQLKIVYCATNRHKLRDNHDTGDAFTSCNSVGYVTRHGVNVMRNDDSVIFRSPCEYHRIDGIA